MTSELTMLRDRLAEINKALTEKGSSVEHRGRGVPEDICIDIARAVQQAIQRADIATASAPHSTTPPEPLVASYPPPAEAALP